MEYEIKEMGVLADERWSEKEESNLRIKVLQTLALTLGYSRLRFLEHREGFEPPMSALQADALDQTWRTVLIEPGHLETRNYAWVQQSVISLSIIAQF